MEKKKRKKNNGRIKEMFYLMAHSTHCIYGYMASEKQKRTNPPPKTRTTAKLNNTNNKSTHKTTN